MRALVIESITILSTSSFATHENWDTFQSVYGIKPTTRIFGAQCTTCHTEVPEHNPFGREAMSAARPNNGKLESSLAVKIRSHVNAIPALYPKGALLTHAKAHHAPAKTKTLTVTSK